MLPEHSTGINRALAHTMLHPKELAPQSEINHGVLREEHKSYIKAWVAEELDNPGRAWAVAERIKRDICQHSKVSFAEIDSFLTDLEQQFVQDGNMDGYIVMVHIKNFMINEEKVEDVEPFTVLVDDETLTTRAKYMLEQLFEAALNHGYQHAWQFYTDIIDLINKHVFRGKSDILVTALQKLASQPKYGSMPIRSISHLIKLTSTERIAFVERLYQQQKKVL